jgi:cell wall-associated NlpC family hydrolase
MTLEAFVEHVGEVMRRAHSLFGAPPKSGRSVALASGLELAHAGDLISGGMAQTLGQSGAFAAEHATFGNEATSNLFRLAGNDERLGDQLREAARTDHTGRTTSGRVINNAAADTAALASYTDTPAGQRALIAALRARLAHQQQVVAAYKRRDAAMASLLRSMTYTSRPSSGGAGMPSAGSGFASPATSGPIGRPSLGGLNGLMQPSSTSRGGDADTVLAARADPRAASVPPGPGGEAATAALSQRGKPYVWGAKGPSSFDCSGLTQWAWAHAGVRLGPDTYSQVQQGVPVDPGDVRAGDLIFPKGSWDSRGPGHVQLAISPTQVVHAPQSGDVVRVIAMPGSFVARRPVPVPSSAEN